MMSNAETIAVAESVTAGLLQFALAQAKDASCFFQGGITAYNIGQKCMHLQVEPIHAQSCDCVSEKVCEQMAVSVAAHFTADWGIAITGYASSTEKVAQPFAHYHITQHGQTIAKGRIDSPREEGPSTQRYFVEQLLEKLDAVL